MLRVFWGSDVITVREKAFKEAHVLETEETITRTITSETYEPGILANAATGMSLFQGCEIIILDTLSEEPDAFEELTQEAKLLHESAHTFICIEGALKAAEVKALAKHADACTEYSGALKERFNAFGLANAFLERDKKTLWLLLMQAWREGLSPEEVLGTLYWQVKMLRLAEKTKSADEAKQKPFVYSKAKRALASFKPGEVDVISRELLTIYHDAHLGKRDMDIALEKWALSL